MANPTPYKIAVPDEELAWITDRVRTARIPPGKDLPTEELWKSWGLPSSYAKQLHKTWTTTYDWRKVERQLNEELTQFTLPINHGGEELTMHFVHNRSPHKDAVPLLFMHGWPGSFLEVRPIIRLLTHPANPEENPEEQAYHVVAPSLPGFGFSSYPKNPVSPMDMAEVVYKLMTALSYDKFMVQGGDWGSIISRFLAANHPDNCRAIHLNALISGPPSPIWNPVAMGKLVLAVATGGWGLTEFEKRGLGRMQWWNKYENGYQAIQGTKPQTIAYGLSDSPFGLACWMREKVQFLTDDDFEWDDEQVITLAMPHIINGTPGHAEIYKWIPKNEERSLLEAFKKVIPRQVSFGASMFPKDILYIPEWWARANVAENLIFWKEHKMGGHFPSIERPATLVADIREFTGKIDKGVIKELRRSGGSQ
ncbi:epoxide hydrolase domain-containing protein [Microdochium trichocladiopsis]|uniref:Epoxide hydrolase domain-containing protein n=1 Tax=Microdochium trichocladiopsis TaxID=1682393 RepID=A0A9P8YD53_9PEZI|nr:epoxide hydrolase domain-containing protein [Microdochium trichocladiopsis]KAH7034766.1 epoxide hydrolase domain-containing protein [Microdochium trichocladiopsis]